MNQENVSCEDLKKSSSKKKKPKTENTLSTLEKTISHDVEIETEPSICLEDEGVSIEIDIDKILNSVE